MQLQYFDGKEFQHCLNIDTVKGLPLDKKVEDLAYYVGVGGEVNALLTEPKAMETCFYNPEDVPSLLYVMTSRGWELILAEDMNVRPKGLHTKENMIILVKETLGANPKEYYNLDPMRESLVANNFDNCIVEVKMVPKAEAIDYLRFTKFEEDVMNYEDGVLIAWPSQIYSESEDTFNFTPITFVNRVDKENVIINISTE